MNEYYILGGVISGVLLLILIGSFRRIKSYYKPFDPNNCYKPPEPEIPTEPVEELPPPPEPEPPTDEEEFFARQMEVEAMKQERQEIAEERKDMANDRKIQEIKNAEAQLKTRELKQDLKEKFGGSH